MTLEERIQNDLLMATKEKDTERVETLRLVKSEIMKAKTAPGFDAIKFDDNAVQKIMQKMCKERDEAADIYKANKRLDLAVCEINEKNIISEYLPKQATEEEVMLVVERVINELNATSIKDMGNVIKKVSSEFGSRSDGKTISTIVKKILSK